MNIIIIVVFGILAFFGTVTMWVLSAPAYYSSMEALNTTIYTAGSTSAISWWDNNFGTLWHSWGFVMACSVLGVLIMIVLWSRRRYTYSEVQMYG